MDYLRTNFQNIAITSSVLVGFGLTGILMDTPFHDEAATANHSSIWELELHPLEANYPYGRRPV